MKIVNLTFKRIIYWTFETTSREYTTRILSQNRIFYPLNTGKRLIVN